MEVLANSTHGDSAAGDMLQVLSITWVRSPLAWQVLSGVTVRRPEISAFQTITVPPCNKQLFTKAASCLGIKQFATYLTDILKLSGNKFTKYILWLTYRWILEFKKYPEK